MTTPYLLDTNILSDLVRNPRGPVAQHIARVGSEQICTNVIVACELRFGARKSGSTQLAARVEQLLSYISVHALDPWVDQTYAQLRWSLEQQGQPIGPNDLLIAADALTHRRTLVTDNMREFARIPELAIENWRLLPE